jgi:hypothetical protein
MNTNRKGLRRDLLGALGGLIKRRALPPPDDERNAQGIRTTIAQIFVFLAKSLPLWLRRQPRCVN